MASAQKGQGILISLIVFVVLTVALGVTTFLLYQHTTDLTTRLAAAEDGKSKAETAKNAAIRERDAMKTRVGYDLDFGAETDPVGGNTLMSKVNEDLRNPRYLPDDANPTYSGALARLAEQKENAEKLLQQRNDDFAKLAKDFEDTRRTLTAERDQHDLNAQAKTADLNAVQASHRTDLAGKNDEINNLMKQATAAVDQKKGVENEYERYRTTKQIELQALSSQVQTFKQGLEKVQALGEPAGMVVSVQYDTVNKQSFAYIDIGEQDRLPLQTTFSVWAPEKNASIYWEDKADKLKKDADKQFEESGRKVALTAHTQGGPKGSIEVVSVGPRQSLARITMSSIFDPIAPGDRLYSPIWTRGAAKHVALVGKFDLSGKGTNDRELLMAMIKSQGGVVDLWVDDEGQIQPPGADVTPRTNWLVLGKIPETAEPNDPETEHADTINRAKNQLADKATSMAVEIVDQIKFYEYLGYEQRSRQYELGAYTGAPQPTNRFENPSDTSRPRGLQTQFEKPGSSTRPTALPGKANYGR
jgi:hypothetical protein